ncbi:MAG TPA: Nudix family hydrolase [Burkholderiales bacterium]|nr:Nudix family hydrolase [Burkholderiales bacterium]
MLEVAAAVLLRDDGSFLLARRPEGKVYAGYWEFPGGKIEPGEAAEAALTRELHEELGIDAQRVYPWITRVFAYPHATVRLSFFRVLGWSGEPHAREQQQIRWQRFDAPIAEPMLPANAPVLAALTLPLEYAVTDAQGLGSEVMLAALERRLAGGLRLVQLRDRDMAPDERTRFGRSAIALARRYGARLLINSDLTLARALGADGVHYTARQLMTLTARPRDIMAAASCHDAGELGRAMALEFDFAVLGPVKPTGSHPQVVPMGWQHFADLARGASLPIFAIGGLRLADLEDAWRAGAQGVAMISGSWQLTSR